MSSFTIRTCPSNRDGSLPEHQDVCLTGDDDSLITVWGERALAEEIALFLEHRAHFKIWLEQKKRAGAA